MAISRNARRLASKLRVARRETDAANSALVASRKAIVRDNLSRPMARDNSCGLVTDYSLVCRPIAKRERRFTCGAANAGTSGGLPVA